MHVRGSSIYFAVVGLTSTSAVLAAVQPYGKCGGMNHQGETSCTDGWTCTKYNDWYSQCVGGQISGGNAPAPTTAVPTEPSAAPVPSDNATSVADTIIAPIPTGNGTEPIALSSTFETLIVTPTPQVEATSVAAAASSVAATAIPSAAPGNNTGGSGKNGADCSIDAAFKAHGKKYIGVATDQGRFSVAENAQVIQDNFGQVTPENR